MPSLSLALENEIVKFKTLVIMQQAQLCRFSASLTLKCDRNLDISSILYLKTSCTCPLYGIPWYPAHGYALVACAKIANFLHYTVKIHIHVLQDLIFLLKTEDLS